MLEKDRNILLSVIIPVYNVEDYLEKCLMSCMNIGLPISSYEVIVVKWLRAFVDADFVITDSFHGCVFSIIFNKPFVAIGNKARGLARFESLLNIFDLGDRLNSSDFNTKIDWKSVNENLAEWKEFSINYLKESLNGES